ncbi:TIGR02757 family protein [Leptospira paudalimensis]|uniref:TIGR02757 family protein n=1 Tax=Leptospira paudalimensis TaxID=2950024 RepID=A0ABT3M613_9LEPT|nr:TIGR02757 family protein [Leptospira paudalimensis]MCW7503834.1 TIGR02757 family protein [Leptospira paudalimensis]
MPADAILLKKKLENLKNKYESVSYLDTDPICFPKQFTDPLDIEIISLVACLFAYGSVKNIQNFLNPIVSAMGPSPYLFLRQKQSSFDPFLKTINGYRFQTKEDLIVFFVTLQRIIQNHKLKDPIFESIFLSGGKYFRKETSIQNFQSYMEQEFKITLGNKPLTYGLQFLIGKWKSKSPKKRISLFLRWMVRNQYPDFGIYKQILPSEIPYPMDVHIQKLSKVLGIRDKKQVKLDDAFLLTEYFSLLNPTDPLLYDFYLTRVGIIEKCKGSYVEEICKVCELREVCLVVPRGIEPRLQG